MGVKKKKKKKIYNFGAIAHEVKREGVMILLWDPVFFMKWGRMFNIMNFSNE